MRTSILQIINSLKKSDFYGNIKHNRLYNRKNKVGELIIGDNLKNSYIVYSYVYFEQSERNGT